MTHTRCLMQNHRVYTFEFFKEFYSWFLGPIHACGLEEHSRIHALYWIFELWIHHMHLTCSLGQTLVFHSLISRV